MKRFTEKLEDGRNVVRDGISSVYNAKYGRFFDGEAVDKLSEYEDLEEQGLLLRLPCKVGDDFYWISDEEPEHGIKSEVKICGKIKGIAVMEDGLYIIGEDGDMNKVGSRYALLTREDAERKLKEMEALL